MRYNDGISIVPSSLYTRWIIHGSHLRCSFAKKKLNLQTPSYVGATSWCLIMQINFFSSESQKDLRGGSFLWHGDNVTWKAWLQEPLKFPNWRPGRKDHDETAVYALSVGQAKPGLLILVQRNTCLFCSAMSLKAWETHGPSPRVESRGERWDKVRNHTD